MIVSLIGSWRMLQEDYSVKDSVTFECCTIDKSYPTLCKLINCSMPGSSVLHYLRSLRKFVFIESVMLSNHLILCHPLLLCPQSFWASGSFLISQLFTSGGQSIGASALASPLNSTFLFKTTERLCTWLDANLCSRLM